MNKPNSNVQNVVAQIINMLHNDVMEGYGLEPFLGWCNDGEVFDHNENDVKVMNELTPYVDALTSKIDELLFGK